VDEILSSLKNLNESIVIDSIKSKLKKGLLTLGVISTLLSNPLVAKNKEVKAELEKAKTELSQRPPSQPKEFKWKNLKDFLKPRSDGQLNQWYNLSDWEKEGLYYQKYLDYLKKYGEWVNNYGNSKEISKWEKEYKEIETKRNEWCQLDKTHVEEPKDIVDASKVKKVKCGSKEGEERRISYDQIQYSDLYDNDAKVGNKYHKKDRFKFDREND
jgi:hypothetical protein